MSGTSPEVNSGSTPPASCAIRRRRIVDGSAKNRPLLSRERSTSLDGTVKQPFEHAAQRRQEGIVACDEDELRMLRDDLHLNFQPVGKHEIVGVHAREPFRLGIFDGVLQRALESYGTELKNAQSRV